MSAEHSEQAACIRIVIEVPIHKHYPNSYRDEQLALLDSAVEAAVRALRAAAATSTKGATHE